MKIMRGGSEEAIEIISTAVNDALGKGSVLLLLSGGSNIGISRLIRDKLDIGNTLTVGLIDERYGEPGHEDSNWQKLVEAGFDFDETVQLPVLDGSDIETTARNYSLKLEEAFAASNTVIGVFGIGEDGHTAGVLPGSPAVKTDDIVSRFKAKDFERITTTPALIDRFDTAFLVAIGGDKREQLNKLIGEELPVSTQPVQYLKKARQLIIISSHFSGA